MTPAGANESALHHHGGDAHHVLAGLPPSNQALMVPVPADESVSEKRKKPLTRQHWQMCGQLSIQLVAMIPLPSISLRTLVALQRGQVVLSSWSSREDVPLMAGDTFLANVSCEASGSALAVRISSFEKRTSGMQAATQQQGPRKALTTLPNGSISDTDLEHTMDDILLPTSICFGTKSMPVQHLLDLATGDAIVMDRQLSAEVSMMVAGRVVAHGDLVAVKQLFGIRLSNIAELSKRLPFFHTTIQHCTSPV